MLTILVRSMFVLLLTTMVSRAATKDAIVIIYAQFPGHNSYEIGTGVFVDHDGLVLTADHILHHISLSPPATSTAGSVPSGVSPVSISIYSAFLSAKIDIDLRQAEAVAGGRIGAQQWMDIALIRVPLTESQRLQIQPLDLSQSAPAFGEALSAYGPLCTNPDDSRCFQPAITATVLNSDPARSRDYQVRDNITLGYSGGPLVNTSGDVVAVASWGDVSIGNQIVRGSYVPSLYVLRYFLDRAPTSVLLAAADACDHIHSLPYLTSFDWQELSARWNTQANLLQNAEQCTCCCESLDKARNALGAPSVIGSCAPPFCAERRFYALAETVSLALQTKSTDAGTARAYQSLKLAFAQIDVKKLPAEKQSYLLTRFGTTLSEIATNDETSHDPAFSDARGIAIAALERSQQIKEIPENYFVMAELFKSVGDKIHAAAADVLGTVIDVPASAVRSDLKINRDALLKNLQAGVAAQSKDTAHVFDPPIS